MAIEWRESLSVGVPEIDEQHRELLRHFNALLKACEESRGMGELNRLIGFLDEYVVQHFSDEERIQRLRNYGGYLEHRREHESFVARLTALKREIAEGGVAIHHVTETNNLLLKWLINHISKVDRQLGVFLRGHQE